MDPVLAGLKWNIFLVNSEDVYIYSKTFQDHLRDLEEVSDRLIEANMQLNHLNAIFFNDN